MRCVRALPDGKYTGRKPTAMAKAESVKALLESGMSKAEVCRSVGISKASLYRILAA